MCGLVKFVLFPTRAIKLLSKEILSSVMPHAAIKDQRQLSQRSVDSPIEPRQTCKGLQSVSLFSITEGKLILVRTFNS